MDSKFVRISPVTLRGIHPKYAKDESKSMKITNGIGAVLLVLALSGCGNGETPPEPTGDTLFVKRLEEGHIEVSQATLNANIDTARHYCRSLPTVAVADDQKFGVLASYVAAISHTGSSVANKTGSESYLKASVAAYCPELSSLFPPDDSPSLSGDDLFVAMMQLGDLGSFPGLEKEYSPVARANCDFLNATQLPDVQKFDKMVEFGSRFGWDRTLFSTPTSAELFGRLSLAAYCPQFRTLVPVR